MDFNFTLPEDYACATPRAELTLPEGETQVVLHCCCAPCSTAVLECMVFHQIRPILFFYNPNIHPADEYEKRRDELLRMADLLKLEAVVGDYDTKKWFSCVKGYEDAPERGARCDICFCERLRATAEFAKARGVRVFTTTLATSRWKSKPQVDKAGFKAQESVPGSLYWDIDWRKNGLVGRRYELVKEIGFYNQRYCGCVFSMRQALAQNKAKDERELMRSSLETDEAPAGD